MADDTSKKRLGRGLAALIGEMDKPPEPMTKAKPGDRHLPIELIYRSSNNPRHAFGDDELNELAASIKEHGVIQPVVVRSVDAKTGDPRYEIIAGERRWRAAQRAGLTEIPVIIRDVDDKAALELAIIENVQRSDLNSVEEAMGYQQLMEEHGYTQADLGTVIGKSRSHVANTLRLLKLSDYVRSMVINGTLSAGHARTLVTADNPESLAERIVREGLSVRQAESIANGSMDEDKAQASSATRPAGEKDADTRALEKVLSDSLGLRVSINHRGEGGDMKIRYSTLDQLDDICRLLQRG